MINFLDVFDPFLSLHRFQKQLKHWKTKKWTIGRNYSDQYKNWPKGFKNEKKLRKVLFFLYYDDHIFIEPRMRGPLRVSAIENELF